MFHIFALGKMLSDYSCDLKKMLILKRWTLDIVIRTSIPSNILLHFLGLKLERTRWVFWSSAPKYKSKLTYLRLSVHLVPSIRYLVPTLCLQSAWISARKPLSLGYEKMIFWLFDVLPQTRLQQWSAVLQLCHLAVSSQVRLSEICHDNNLFCWQIAGYNTRISP